MKNFNFFSFFSIFILRIFPIICANNATSRTRLTQNETNLLLQKFNLLTFSNNDDIDDWFDRLNEQHRLLSQIIAAIAWELSINPSDHLNSDGVELTTIKSQWRNLRCDEANFISTKFHSELTRDQFRMIYLLCRGPKFTNYQASELNQIMGKIFEINTETEVCVKKDLDFCRKIHLLPKNTYMKTEKGEFYRIGDAEVPEKVENANASDYICMKNEPDMEKIIKGDFSPFGELRCLLPRDMIFRWAWESVRQAIGPRIGTLFSDAIPIMNVGAKNNGYRDLSEVWIEELDVPNLKCTADNLLMDINPLYTKLFSVARHVLLEKYPNVRGFTFNSLIPADIFGNMYAQDWSSLIPDLILPYAEVDLNDRLSLTKWNVRDMVRRSEDFYSSLGLFPMTEAFWQKSIFEQSSNVSKCHGSAANMYEKGDFRMIVCAEKTINDLYTIVHEMGHIEYYMNYDQQPSIFQDATSTAFGEAVGDSIFTAMMTPQHLSRLGLIEDKYLYHTQDEAFTEEYLCGIYCRQEQQDRIVEEIKIELGDRFLTDLETLGTNIPDYELINEKIREKYKDKPKTNQISAFDVTLLIHMALAKVPQIPFSYIMDTFRWDLFSGKVKYSKANEHFWTITKRESGIKPPGNPPERNPDAFDAGVKFHFADNIPMMRYFLASFLQAQIFKGLCEVTYFGKIVAGKEKLPMPLHRCDIYGSKKAGKLLKKALSMGASRNWSEVLFTITGEREIKADALLEYYKPLDDFLENLILKYDIPYGWIGPV
ncbi:angiotensin-converting enzyme-like [Culicoides brevitarsis]|uniref:angiotensin-converting enzyme-like n=1 Tax=Culicoides brevitarsis TaxID=469753 RepID=UPI00307C75D1